MLSGKITFYGMGIAPKILEALERMKFVSPTPIQHKAIPILIEGKDIIGIAQTGTGKTLAFAIPIVQKLAQAKGTALVLVPTRELAIQVDETFQKLMPVFGMKSAVLIGGAPMNPQVEALRRNPRVIIATPGRLIDHMGQWNVIPQEISLLVLDEADRMLDMGFQPQIEKILRHLPRERQTMLFSATMPSEILKIATTYMKLPVSVEIAPSGTTVERVTQELFIVKREEKMKLLEKVLHTYKGSVLLFARTKHGARKIAQSLKRVGQRAAEIHSDRSLSQRREALEGFKSGRYRVLVATDIAARGIDVKDIELVINFDLPDEAENYVHRIGRTARAGHDGRAISFATPDQKRDVQDIEKCIRVTLPIVHVHPGLTLSDFSEAAAGPRMHGRGQRQHHGQGRGHGHAPGRGGFSRRRHFAFIIAGLLLFSSNAFGATLKTREGKIIEGDVVSRDDASVKMNVQGIELTYWAGDIDSLTLNDGTRVTFAATPAVAAETPATPTLAANPVLTNATTAGVVPNPIPPAAGVTGQTTEPSPGEMPPVEGPGHRAFRQGTATLRGDRPENMAAFVAITVFVGLLVLALYAYVSVCLKMIADKTGTANSWWAWIPIANLILMCDIAQKPRWWAALFLLGAIPAVGIIAAFIVSCLIQMDMAVRRGKPNWWGVLMSLPLINLFAYGYVAFSK